MKVILRADVEKLGHLGDIVNVKPGYGRNYLLPQQLASLATPANIRERHQQELQEMYQRLQQAQQDNADNFQKEQQKKMQPVTQKIIDAVNAVAKEGSYVYIVDMNAAQGAGIIINESISSDVTSAVMAKLGISAAAAKPAPAQ